MSVAIYINNAQEARALVSWGVRFAQADVERLLIVVPRREKQDQPRFESLALDERDTNDLFKSVFTAIENHSSDHVVLKEKIAAGDANTDHDRTLIETLELVATNPEKAFVQNVGELDIKTLILPVSDDIQVTSSKAGWAQQLYQSSPCETFMVRGAPPERAMNVLVVCNRDQGASAALRRARKLANGTFTGTAAAEFEQMAASVKGEPVSDDSSAKTSTKGSVDFLYVRSDDDEVAYQVAELHTKKILSKAGPKNQDLQAEIALSDNLMEVIAKRNNSAIDLVLMGTTHLKTIRSLLRAGLTKNDKETPISVAVMRPAVPLGNRLQRNLRQRIQKIVPQLEKEDRVRLVDRLQEGSSFNFDFAALISLSTIIAALGLLDDSAAVVIGAMLVAPLMTPLVGIGFALIQGNERLMRTALKSVVMGFALAFAIAGLVGILAVWFSSLGISPQMNQRDFPSLLDLFVALFSGVAGAYAMSRPNLLSALPGVAIAAALVPPIATAGMALAIGDGVLGGGALLLFLTNIVAIVLGTAVTFWTVGIHTRLVKSPNGGNERPPRMWPRYWFIAFVILSFLLAAEFHYLARMNKTAPPNVETNKTELPE